MGARSRQTAIADSHSNRRSEREKEREKKNERDED